MSPKTLKVPMDFLPMALLRNRENRNQLFTKGIIENAVALHNFFPSLVLYKGFLC